MAGVSDSSFLKGVKFAHLIQNSLLVLLLNGVFRDTEKIFFSIDFESVNLECKDFDFVVNESVRELNKLLTNLANLYGVSGVPEFCFVKIDDAKVSHVLTFRDSFKSNIPFSVIQEIDIPLNEFSPVIYEKTLLDVKEDISESELAYFLFELFEYNSFREGQLESIKRLLCRKDTITLLPTGGGKSLIFQLVKYLSQGIVIIVAPTKALIQDQVENLYKRGISRGIGINSDLDQKKLHLVLDSFHNGGYQFVYVCPERFLIKEFEQSINCFTKTGYVSCIVVDEAHCVSEWGHDFRPSYLTLGSDARQYCKRGNFIPPVLALTGTASENALRDIQNDLQISVDGIVSPNSFDRPEIRYNVLKCLDNSKIGKLKTLIKEDLPKRFGISPADFVKPNGINSSCGIIFCPTTGELKPGKNKRHSKGVMTFCEELKKANIDSRPYHSGNIELTVKDKEKNARDFKDNKFTLMIATKGYGMGIDKPNIRYVIHSYLPHSVEQFYQEAGRAGRDRKNSESFILYSHPDSKSDLDLINLLIDPDTNYTIFKEKYDLIQKDKYDNRKWNYDIFNALYFHTGNFKGVKADLYVLNEICKEIKDFSKEQDFAPTKFSKINMKNFLNDDTEFDEDTEFKFKQKAIIRLKSIGVLKAYTVDYLTKEFLISISGSEKKDILSNYLKLISTYNPQLAIEEKKELENYLTLSLNEFIQLVCKKLIDFNYYYYEKGRRRAIKTMLTFAEEAVASKSPDTSLRDNVTNFFKRTYSDDLTQISNSIEFKTK